MGANPDAITTFKPVPNELPQRRVTIKTFAIGKYEVTQAQWFDVMGERPSEFTGDDLPVETVSWNDIHNFIRKLNTKTDERVPVADRGGVGIRGPCRQQRAILLWR